MEPKRSLSEKSAQAGGQSGNGHASVASSAEAKFDGPSGIRKNPAVASPGNKSVRATGSVTVVQTELVLPTYLPAPPDKHPMFLEKRVYQGSSGKVYPLPFTDRINEKPIERKWKALWIENEFLKVLVLPEIGGRIHAIQDKTNGFDLIYNQPVIKPALVGLAGPWISGGIEFNWPQHHRPATFLPVDVSIEEHADGSKTIWCSDHDPMVRMKGMHGVCLHPDRAIVELKVRAYNRTPLTQTFLWWANVAIRVHERYQSFFPPDVSYVADHARRSVSEYPLAKGIYYGVNYGERGRKGVPAHEIPSQFIPPHSNHAIRNTQHGAQKSKIPSYAPNDLSWYANIPTPCSYMCLGSNEDFFGGYDHFADAGIVHVANHHIAPGKKQWTWGNHEFGYAWDRNLTEKDGKGEYGPYIELMAGVYTDNQPDFSFLLPGETKTWSQFWYPIQKIGPAQKANLEAAVSLKVCSGRCKEALFNAGSGTVRDDQSLLTSAATIQVGVSVTREFKSAQIILFNHGETFLTRDRHLAPGRPFVESIEVPENTKLTELTLRLSDDDGREIISYTPSSGQTGRAPLPATEPRPPQEITSNDELYLAGLHLEQYRHATRCPTLYWREALRRDPLDARCNNALGLWHLRRGEFREAEIQFQNAIQRLTRRNPNPSDGEPYYNLGLCLRYQLDGGGRARCPRRADLISTNATRRGGDTAPYLWAGITTDSLFDAAYAAFYKATWNHACQSAAYHALAEMDCRKFNWATALQHLDRSLARNAENTRARNLKALVLRQLGPDDEAQTLLRETLELDPLDWWARHLSGQPVESDLQVNLDLAHDCARAGFYTEAISILERAVATTGDLPDQSWGAAPLVYYTLGWLHEKCGDTKSALAEYRRGGAQAPDYCCPARLEEIAILEAAMRANPRDGRAPYYLGNLLYDRRRHVEAIRYWERSARLDPSFSVVWRNLGIGCFNVLKRPTKAEAAYEKAFRADPNSSRVLYERDQLWKRLRKSPAKRLAELQKHRELVLQRDDLSVELCGLYNQLGRHEEVLALVNSRKFQPWEGGEGGALGQRVRSHIALGRQALARNEPEAARDHFLAALEVPENLGEAKHFLANQSDILLFLGDALQALGDSAGARKQWLAAATFKGDFQGMSVRAFSEMTYYSALAWQRLGRKAKATKLLRDLLTYARKLRKTEAKIDYFATSLPTMLLFEEGLQFRQEMTALLLEAQAWFGLGQKTRGRALLRKILKSDPSHALAADLLAENL
jgi:tetratricopeptide (TPR) repeat protein